MHTTKHPVLFRYTRQELLALFDRASQEDVDAGGRYDRRSGAINVWSHHWGTTATKHDSETLGTFYAHWTEDIGIYQVECQSPSWTPLHMCGMNSTVSDKFHLNEYPCGANVL